MVKQWWHFWAPRAQECVFDSLWRDLFEASCRLRQWSASTCSSLRSINHLSGEGSRPQRDAACVGHGELHASGAHSRRCKSRVRHWSSRVCIWLHTKPVSAGIWRMHGSKLPTPCRHASPPARTELLHRGDAATVVRANAAAAGCIVCNSQRGETEAGVVFACLWSSACPVVSIAERESKCVVRAHATSPGGSIALAHTRTHTHARTREGELTHARALHAARSPIHARTHLTRAPGRQ